MKVLVFLGACVLFASALPVEDDDGRIYTMTTTTTTTTTTTISPTTSTTTASPVTTTLPCQTPPPSNIPCPACVHQHCITNQCNQALPLPYPGDCNKFCMCETSGTKEIYCPSGLYFNAAAYVCDWPQTAGCTYESTYEVLKDCPRG